MPDGGRGDGVLLPKDFWCSGLARLSFPTHSRLRRPLQNSTICLVFSAVYEQPIPCYGKAAEESD